MLIRIRVNTVRLVYWLGEQIINNSLLKIEEIECLGTWFENCIKAYVLHLDLFAPIPNEHWQNLNINERNRAEKFLLHADKVRFVITRSILKQLLSDFIGTTINEITFKENKFGKPSLVNSNFNKDFLQFNISHSGNKALIGFSNEDLIGVDIQQVIEFENHKELLDSYIYSNEELTRIHSNRAEKIDLCKTWIMKEAVVKAAGCGLSCDITSFSIIRDKKRKSIFKVKSKALNWNGIRILFLNYDENYSLAIATMKATDYINN
ncbi:4'-phosphopantetheinyl transferase family protein [Psychrobacter aquimaris]|uniref:4'-phosphopantetheinyl transferase family protein n=1 Tax=Psychrobacter aquimaris TaxID=292733 RepID=UPI003FD2449C